MKPSAALSGKKAIFREPIVRSRTANPRIFGDIRKALVITARLSPPSRPERSEGPHAGNADRV
jgi:hypothetical protein